MNKPKSKITRVPFTKVVGTGNDFILVDTQRYPQLAGFRNRWNQLSQILCNRHQGIGADGLLVLEPSTKSNARMRIFNADGSEASMCGNGARCVAQYLKTGAGGGGAAKPAFRGTPSPAMILPARSQGAGVNGSSFVIETKAGLIQAVVEGQEVAMRMTDPTGLQLALELSAEGRKFQAGFINTGVPHLVVPVEDLQKLDVESLGRSLRRHPHFAPQGTNVNFIPDAPDSGKLRVRTYERGVEAETLACGTGITASAILHALWQGAKKYNPRVVSSTPRKIKVLAKSGDILTVSFRVSGSWDKPQLSHVILQGQAKSVFEGFIFWSNK